MVINTCEAKGWLESLAMDPHRARLYEALHGCDRRGRFDLHTFNDGGNAVYVHAKIMVVDDVALRVGSSNLNARSMRLDTECDVVISTTVAANAACGTSIRAFHYGLLYEHLRVDATTIAAKIRERGSLIAAIEELRGGVKTTLRLSDAGLGGSRRVARRERRARLRWYRRAVRAACATHALPAVESVVPLTRSVA